MTDLEREDIRTIAQLPCAWEKLDGKTIMISGGTGFIGSFLCEVLRYRNQHFHSGIHIVSLSRRGGQSDETTERIAADITQPIRYDGKVDYILHLASNTHPAQYASDPVGTITTNIIGCNNLLRLGVERQISRFLLASSVEIYGQGTPEPMDETYSGYLDCNNARAGYNEAKRTCEALCQSYRSQYGMNVVIARLARTVGADRKKDTKAISQFMDRAVQGEDIILKSKGNQRYSFCYVADTAGGLLKVLLDGGNGEAYNISDDDEGKTLGGYAELIARLAGKQVVYQIEDNASVSRAVYALMDTGKIRRLGWKPAYTVTQGLERTYQIYHSIKS